MPRSEAARSDLATAVAIALAAYAFCDLVHEALGHGLASLMTPDVRIVSLSTVALQTVGESRVVAAAGPLANVLAGALALAFFHRAPRLSPTGYFVWLFAALNLMNGAGYLLFSAVLGSGDVAVVIAGLEPAWLWRLATGIVGGVAYVGVVRLAANELARAVERSAMRRAEIPRLVLSSYVAGGVLLVAASVLNPIGPSLILTSGLSSGFAAMAGLTLVPRIVDHRTTRSAAGEGALPRSRRWIAAGIAIAVLFVGVVGPGIRF